MNEENKKSNFKLHNAFTSLLVNVGGLIPYFNLLINRRSHMIMIQLLTSNIIDEHFDYHYRNVPRIFKKQVKEQLIANGAGHLADDNVTNYIGPRPKLADDPLFSNLKKDGETDNG